METISKPSLSHATEQDEVAWLFTPPLLTSESIVQYGSFRTHILQDFRPRNFIERIQAEAYAYSWSESERWRRNKVGIINATYEIALQNLLFPLSELAGADTNILARRYFTDRKARRQVLALLKQVGLDEKALEAEALRIALIAVEALETLQASAETRGNKILRLFEERRAGLAKMVQSISE